MIKNVIFSLIFFSLIIAISIKVIDPTITYVHIGKPFLALLNSTSLELESFKIEIPSIPLIDKFEVDNSILIVINFLIDVVNGLSSIINFIIQVLNIIIKVIQFITILIKNIIVFRDTLIENAYTIV